MAKERYALIDWLKAFCVVLVIITHSDFLNDAMLDKSGLFYLLCVNKAVPCFMFLSGYVFSMGAKAMALNEQYSLKRIFPGLMRLTVPTLIYYAIYVAVLHLSGNPMSLSEILFKFFAGDFGKGSYYFSIMVQFTLVAPLMHVIIKKYAHWGLVIIGAMNFAFEGSWTLFSLHEGLYRILVFRYLLIIAFGMFLSQRKGKMLRPVYIGAMALVGLTYILLPYFTSYEYKIFTIDPWNRSGMMSAFYVAAVLYVLFHFFSKARAKGFVGKAIAKVGQASYHIMYTQMLYFIVRPAIDTRILKITTLPLWSQYAMDIVVSVLLGLVFCVADAKSFRNFYKTK